MPATRTEFPTTEGVLLLRQDGKTMAVHLVSVTAILEAIIHENPNIDLGFATHYGGTVIEGYQVEATGRADRLYLWTGHDPFAEKRELDAPLPVVLP
jgi:hypothetical protein